MIQRKLIFGAWIMWMGRDDLWLIYIFTSWAGRFSRIYSVVESTEEKLKSIGQYATVLKIALCRQVFTPMHGQEEARTS